MAWRGADSCRGGRILAVSYSINAKDISLKSVNGFLRGAPDWLVRPLCVLEREAQTETQRALGLVGGCDHHEVRGVGYRRIGILELRRVGHVQRLRAELQIPPFAEVEPTE